MVGPSDRNRGFDRISMPVRLRSDGRSLLLLLLTTSLIATAGCNFVPRSRLEDGHRVAQTLRSENNRLKDQALDLRTKNQDLIQRAQDDARRLAIQDEALDRLEKSVSAYQSERDQLADAFETFKQQARLIAAGTSAGTTASAVEPPANADDPLDVFANQHPDWTFDRDNQSLSIPTARLFDPGSVPLRADSSSTIQALGAAFAKAAQSNGKTHPVLEIDAQPEPSADVQQAVFSTNNEADPETEASRRFLGASRAARLRDALVREGGLDPSALRIAPPADPSDSFKPIQDHDPHDQAATAGEPRLTFRLRTGDGPKSSTSKGFRPLDAARNPDE